MSDPYRDEATRKHEALLAEERELLVRAGKVMVWAGIVGLVAVVVGLKLAIAEGAVGIVVSVVLPGIFSALTLQAGLVLAGLPGGSRDYGEIEKAVKSLGVVYTVKGVIVLCFIALFVVAFFAPMVLRLLR
jgi:hypothetical protein